MKRRLLGLFQIIGLFVGMTVSFSNCSSNYEQTQYASSCPDGNCSSVVGQSLSLTPQSDDIWMRCFQDHYYLGGSCNPGNYALNFIKYTIVREGGFQEASTNNATCENGRFYLMIRRPNDSGAPAGAFVNGYVEYRMNMQIFSANNEIDPAVAGPQYTAVVKVQWTPANPGSVCTLTTGL